MRDLQNALGGAELDTPRRLSVVQRLYQRRNCPFGRMVRTANRPAECFAACLSVGYLKTGLLQPAPQRLFADTGLAGSFGRGGLREERRDGVLLFSSDFRAMSDDF
jgi:hypothetical protein